MGSRERNRHIQRIKNPGGGKIIPNTSSDSRQKAVQKDELYSSDKIRLSYIKKALSSPDTEFWEPYPFQFDHDKDLTIIQKKENIIHYYELWADICWHYLFTKPEYKSLSKEVAIEKFVKERMSIIGKYAGVKIKDWEYDSKTEVLKVILKKKGADNGKSGY